MLYELQERRPFVYEPPPGLPPSPTLPRACWTARAADGAALDAYVWGSVLGEPFTLEVRRYGAPAVGLDAYVEAGGQNPDAMHHAPEAPRFGELQAFTDRLIPAGAVMFVALASVGALAGDANERAAQMDGAEYRVVRLGQLGVLQQQPAAAPSRLIGGRA